MAKRASRLTWLGLLLAASQVGAGEERFRVEVTAGWPEFRPSSYVFPADEVRSPGFSLQELSFIATLGRFEGFLTRDCELEEATHWGPSGPVGDGYAEDDSLSMSAVDLGGAYPLRLGATTALRPLLGLTYVQRQLTRHTVFAREGVILQDEMTDYGSDGWGLLAGCELTWEPAPRVRVVVRAQQRWAAGTETSDYHGRLAIVDWATQEVVGYEERFNSSSMKGAALLSGGSGGLGVRLAGSVWVEGGWRYRSNGYSDWFGAWQGPYVSVSAAF